MTTAAAQPTVRQRLESILHNHPGRGVALTRLYELLPDAAVSQVRLTVKNLMKRGLVIRHGTIRYPAYQLVRKGNPLHQPPEAAPVELVRALRIKPASKPRARGATATAVTWPDGVKVQHWPAPVCQLAPFAGTDWRRSMLRPGCQDHELVPSRRGDVRVMPRGAMGICGARKRQELADKWGNP